MEISRRHLQELKMRERVEAMTGQDTSNMEFITAEDQERAEEMQRQVDGLSRNQRRVLHKRTAKAARKAK